MTRTCTKGKRGQVIFSLLLGILFVVLLGCTSLQSENLPTRGSEVVPATPIPTVVPTPTLVVTEVDPFPFNLDEVQVLCQFDANITQDYDHWADALIPGVSTINDLLALTSVPEDTPIQRTGTWTYMSDDADLVFYEGILEQKADPRTKLSEIVQHYGPPQMIVWEIPRRRFDEASYLTNLVYPEHKAVFFEWDKITQFAFNTEFRHSTFSTQEIFDAILARFVDDDSYRYEELVWPCPE